MPLKQKDTKEVSLGFNGTRRNKVTTTEIMLLQSNLTPEDLKERNN